MDSFAAVAFPRWIFLLFSALKQKQIPAGMRKYDVHMRILQMNSLGLLA